MSEMMIQKNPLMEACQQLSRQVLRRSYADKSFAPMMRRNVGKTINTANANVLLAFYGVFDKYVESDDIVKKRFSDLIQDDKAFFVMCLQCLWRPEDYKNSIRLEKVVGSLPQKKESLKKHFYSILNLSWDEDGFLAGKIYHFVRMCWNEGIVIDCASLLYDLLEWEKQDKYNGSYVKKRWARDFMHMYSIKSDE